MQSNLTGQSRIVSLKSRKDIQDVFLNGQRQGNRYGVLYYKNNTKCCIRTGVFIPKRVFKKAVDRNRAKRIIREVIRQNKNGLQDLDIIYVLKQCRREEIAGESLQRQITPLLRETQ